jgi:ribosomal protein S18 acetylase RimI-like enzyme
MVELKTATLEHIEILALLGRITYTESHGEFIDDKNDLLQYNNEAFSISKLSKDLKDAKNLFYIAFADGIPVGYAKLILNETHETIASANSCRMDKIYILNDFIPLKIGQQLLSFLEEKFRELELDTIWLATYIKNFRAIKFYTKNEYKAVGEINFSVNGKEYPNIIFSKDI